MRRLITILVLGCAIPVVVVLGMGADDGGGSGYKVRAVFDNVASAVPGEDVKVAGAKVGVIDSMDVTQRNKAAVTLRIDDSRFAPFRADAKCIVRPQSLIGEKFVECDPGTDRSKPLAKIKDGAGKGQHLLPLARTSSPVDLDLVNDVLRRPFRERLALLLGEFGAGVAGRGEDLNKIIHRANPALRDTDKVLAILGRQNRVLANLARDSDQALAPLAREKKRVSDFIVKANETGQATAERRGDIELGIQRLPGFLTQLKPLMADLQGFAGDATPVARDLNRAAPDVSRLIRQLGPFSRAARPSIETLGDATVTGRPALLRTRPLIQDLGRFATNARPLSTNLDRLTKSLDETGGIERVADYLFFQMLAINGFDGIGHYLRAGLSVNLCSTYAATAPASGCNSNFTGTRVTSSGAGRLSPQLADAAAVLRGKKGGKAKDGRDKSQGSVPAQGGVLGGILGTEQTAEGRKTVQRIRKRAAEGSPALQGTDEPMLDYLLGSGR
jgi:phospholipid/cholesterol/gamma-HCH transport system substrate-binding protein